MSSLEKLSKEYEEYIKRINTLSYQCVADQCKTFGIEFDPEEDVEENSEVQDDNDEQENDVEDIGEENWDESTKQAVDFMLHLTAWMQLGGALSLFQQIYFYGHHGLTNVIDNCNTSVKYRRTIDEFFEDLRSLPSECARDIICLFDCSPSIKYKLTECLESQEDNNKEHFKQLIYDNEVNVEKYSSVLWVLLLPHIAKPDEAVQRLYSKLIHEEYLHYKNLDLSQDPGAKFYFEYLSLCEQMPEKVAKFNEAAYNKDKELAEKILKTMAPDFQQIDSLYKQLLFGYWNEKEYFLPVEQKAIETIFEPLYEQLYDKVYEEYLQSKGNILPPPPGFTEEQLNALYEKIHEYCPAGQNFMYFFGYGDHTRTNDSPHLIWNKDGMSLAYFIKVLYGGKLNDKNKIVQGKKLRDSTYEAAVQVFRDNNGESFSKVTIKGYSWTKCPDETLEKIFVEVLQSTADSKIG